MAQYPDKWDELGGALGILYIYSTCDELYIIVTRPQVQVCELFDPIFILIIHMHIHYM